MQDPGFRLNRRHNSISGLKSLLVATLCALLLTQPLAGAAQEPPAQSTQSPVPASTEISSSLQPPTSVDELPSAPVPQPSLQQAAQQQSQPAQQTNPAQQQNQPAQQPPAQQQSNGPQQSNTPQQPVGTAAAPYEKPTGVPGSRPAGAAIAPAKQRRVRAIVISLGLILAGAGAIGAVAGMSKASHSQP